MKRIAHIIMSLSLSVCCIFSLLSITSIPIQGEESIVVDDTEDAFSYSIGDANDGGWDSCGGNAPSVTEHWSNTVGATVTIRFEGTKIELYGKKASNHRKFSVSIDDGEPKELDAYASYATGNDTLLFESDTMAQGEHTLLLTILDQYSGTDPNPLGMNIAYAKVFGTQTEIPEEKGYTDVDDAVSTTTGELFKIQYEPSSQWNGESGYPNLFYDGTDHYSTSGTGTESDHYTMKFIGTGIEIYASKNTSHANFDVYIDDQLLGSGKANLLSGQTQHKQKLFEVQGLADGEHVLRVEKSKDETAVKAMQGDKIRVYHDEIAPTAIELNKTEITLAPGGSNQVIATMEPWIVSADALRWESSDAETVTVENGVITAKDVGSKKEAVVTAVSTMDETIRCDVKVTVDPALAVMNAYVGNEKRLDLGEDYETLATGSNTNYSATAWKGDRLNSKVIVASMSKDIHQVECVSSDFVSASGQTISKDHIQIKWLKEVEANDGRNMAGEVKSFPNIIYKGGAKDIKANDLQFAWIMIDVPVDAAAGVYTGTISVIADELEEPIDLVYTVEVLNLLQPEPELTEIQIWQHPFSVANYYLGLGAVPSGGISYDKADDFYFTKAHFDLMRDATKEYAQMGGHAAANIVEEAWDHQSYYGDPSMVKWTKKADGSWTFDYTWYDAWINFMIECGVIDPQQNVGQIKCYSIVPWSNQITYYDEALGKTVSESHNPGEESWKAMWKPFLEDFLAHSKENGWFEIAYISMDERGLDQLRPAVELIESVTDEDGNHFKISSALNYAAPEYYDFTDRIDDISINLGNASNVSQMRELSKHRQELGLTTTYYTCTGDYPSNFMISDPGDNYWTIWYTMTLGTDGYMRWAWDNYVYDMFGDASYRYWEPGDGWFIYPLEREDDAADGINAAYYSTPRYELFKQGIRDVAKAKYLLSSDEVTQEQKDELKAVVENLARPAKGNYHGSAVAANEEQRMLVHRETQRALTATNEVARELSERSLQRETALEQLRSLIQQAQEIDAKGYTAESYEQLQDAFARAIAVEADKSASIADIEKAAVQLNEAIQGLEKMLDYSSLLLTIEQAETIAENLDSYISSTVKDFDTLLAKARSLLNQAQEQEEIDEMERLLAKAIDQAQKQADKAALIDAVAKAENINSHLYTEDTVQRLNESLAEAKEMIQDENVAQNEVDQLVKRLNEALQDLEMKEEGSNEDLVDTGISVNGSMEMVLLMLSLVSICVLKKRSVH